MTLLVQLLLVAACLTLIAVMAFVVLFRPPPLQEGFPAETPKRRAQHLSGVVVPLRHGSFIRPHGFDADGEYVERHPRT